MKEMEIDGKGQFLEDGRVEAVAVTIFPLGDGADETLSWGRWRCEFDTKEAAEDIVIIGCKRRGWIVDAPDTSTGNDEWISVAAVKVVEDAAWVRV